MRDPFASDDKLDQRHQQLLQEMKAKNIPQTIRDERCKEEGQFIHLYPDGTEYLVSIDDATLEVTQLKQL